MTHNGIRRRGAGRNRSFHHFVRALWISRIARRQFRPDRLCQRLFEMPLSGGIHLPRCSTISPWDFILPRRSIKDAQRHGLKMLPVDVMESEWMCTLQAISTHHSARSQIASGKVNGCQLPVASEASAAERRNNAAHSVSRGEVATTENSALEGRQEYRSPPGPALCPGIAPGIGASPGARTHPSGIHFHSRSHSPRSRTAQRRTHHSGGNRRAEQVGPWSVAICQSIGIEDRLGTRDSGLATRYSELCPPSPPRRPLASRARCSHLRPASRKSTRTRFALTPSTHESRRAPGRRLPRHGHHRRPTSHVLPPRMAQGHGHSPRIELRDLPSGKRLRIGGCVITRQRPGTAKGFVFLSLEDETGVANAIVTPDLFHRHRLLLTRKDFWRSKEFCKIRTT